MTDVYSKFIHKKPKCFQSFQLEDAKDIKSDWVQGPEFLSKLMLCPCGNSNLNVFCSYGRNMRLAPISVECPKCNYRAEIFDPRKHGWDGENGDFCSSVGDSEPKIVNGSPSRIIVQYSYQGDDNYEDLSEDVDNLEDYFDVFAVHIADGKGYLTEVVSYECA